MNPPRVFVSYSHDSAQHKKWVLEFASTLRNRGVDVILDQWDLQPGDDLPHFMETQLSTADFVLIVCTSKYVEKANAGEGGVGYEKMIVTSSLLSRIDSNKVIPIVRQNGTNNRPTFLQTKLYVDFSNDTEVEYSLDELLRVLLNAPLYKKPEIGANPFQSMQGSEPDRTSDGLRSVMEAVANTYNGKSEPYIWFSHLVKRTTMHRLTLDKYVNKAIEEDLISRSREQIWITDKGRRYLEVHNIVES
ncbi:toll/interleukin-1 receptor domain-containing protein [Alcanivorax sp.]|uniref:toll/interleukin-1 receptor domain-containing protein n=1 Tax=Alcanivorax sp. TaxID=1872427 RepID=UPI0025C4B947|nr:toll/interleukin-1 receptor domain-containing protein [Alcanivorax sp.]